MKYIKEIAIKMNLKIINFKFATEICRQISLKIQIKRLMDLKTTKKKEREICFCILRF